MKKRSTVLAIGLGLCLIPTHVHAAENGRAILEATNVQGGLVVHIGCGDGRLTAELLGNQRFIVRGLDTDRAHVVQARQYLQAQNVYGPVTVQQFDGRSLPLVDNLVSLVVADEATVPVEEIMRVLHPHGVAYVNGKRIVKPKPDAIDEWTHYLHDADNNAVARDRLVAPPRHMQFLAAPLWTRNHDRLSSYTTAVTAKGRLFAIRDVAPVFDYDEPGQWIVTARNAFSGVRLWTRPIKSWTNIRRGFRSGPVQLQRLLVADGDRVFVTLGLDEPVSVLDAATGADIRVLDETAKAEEFVLSDDVLFVQIGQQGAEQALIERSDGKDIDYRGTKLLKAVDSDSGETLWQWPPEGTAEIMPRTLAVSGGKVFFQENGETVCLDAESGKQQWRSTPIAEKPASSQPAKRGNRKGRPNRGPSGRAPGWTFATLVVADGVVLSCDGKKLSALDAKSGGRLWECAASTPFGRTPSVDVLVVRGVVWTSPRLGEGRDLKTGQVVVANNLGQKLVTAGHHHRCYRNKATERFVIGGYRGLEFRDTVGEEHRRHNWIRGGCQYGIMPANGLVYMPPHNCGCYPEAKLYGLWALKASEATFDVDELTHSTLVEKGPAYGSVSKPQSEDAANEWPTYRHDARRSGVLPTPISATKTAWSTELAGRLSAPAVARGMLIVASESRHQVVALDAETGKHKWSVTTDGAVDSPPTVYGDAVLFGSSGGYVTCLRLADGHLVWRLRAAPLKRDTVALGQVESLWPVHGSILVADGTAYFTAGRSSYLDGGLFLYGVDPLRGEIMYKQRSHIPPATATENTEKIARKSFAQNAVDFKTKTSPDHSDAFSMAGNLSDVMVADDRAVYLRHEQFDKQLQPTGEWKHHLFSTSRLVDESESYRSHWFYGNGDFSRLPVAYEWLTRGSYGGFSTPLGRFLAFDDERLWGAGWKNLALYTTDIRNIDQRLHKDFPKNAEKMMHEKLAGSLPIHPRGMIKAADALYLAGYPADSGVLHRDGEPITDPGVLLKVDAQSGEFLEQTDLPACPVFDGLAAAAGKLFVSLENGCVVCLE